MAFRGNQNRNRNFGGNYGPMGGGGANRMGNLTMSPWDTQNPGSNFGGGGGGGVGNLRQGGGGQGMNAQALNLANNLLNNLFRNQNPPSLLDLPRGGAGMGNRNQRGGQMINRGGGNRINNRRIQGGFPNRGTSGVKSNQKPGAGGIRKQNAFDRAKKLLAKNANNKKKDFAPGDKKLESKESPYASVQNDMFYCHLCKKHMWDANSFENHIKGRTHLMMREGIEESYRLKANMIRQEAKIAEQLKSIELDRLKRMGKSKQRQLEYCTMCDLNFHGHISAHRKSEGHLQLKKFLHPKCLECNNEFATRIDYDSHLLSADHLIKAAERNTKVGERKRNTLAILTEEEELKDIRQPQRRRKKTVVFIKKEGENIGEGVAEIKQEPGETGANTSIGQECNVSSEQHDKIQTGEHEKGAVGEGKECDEVNETQEDEDISPPIDPEDCILDYVEGDEIPTEVENRLPKYNWMRPVGSGLISKLECFECSLCEKFFDSERTVEIHSRTATHHRNFLKFINEKSSDTKIAQKRAAAALEETERKKRRLEEADTSNGQTLKTEETERDEQEGQVGGEEDNGELYDPSEATGDDEDVEMVENGEEEGIGDDGEVGAADYDDENDDDEIGNQSAEQSETTAVEVTNIPDKTPVIEIMPSVVVQSPKPAAPAAVNVTQPEVKSEALIKVTPGKVQHNSIAPATATPLPVANTTPMQNQQPEQISATKRGGSRGGGGNKPSPRGRGRGRYSRY